tara:strand:- start:576 stop:851 length:276 start_codon:yes stop_codon:yes gene_type:complete
MNKPISKYDFLGLEVEPTDDTHCSNIFTVKLIDKKDYGRYERTFYTFNEAYDFYLERFEEKDKVWLDVYIIEKKRRRINPEMYAVMCGLSY